MINGRAKGHAFERELIKIFRDEFGECADHLKRNLDQYQVAGKADIEFNNIMVEAKRYATGNWHKATGTWHLAPGTSFINLIVSRFAACFA